MKIMNSKQLYYALISNEVTEPYFEGVFASDQLEDIVLRPKLIIANTEPSTMKGEHWIAFFTNGETVDVFDSLGKKLSSYQFGSDLSDFTKKFAKNVNIVSTRLQPSNSNICGNLCLYFAYWRCLGESLESIVATIRQTEKNKILKFVENKFILTEKNPGCSFVQCSCEQ